MSKYSGETPYVAGVPVLVGVDELGPPVHLGGDRLDERQTGDGAHVFHGEGLGLARPGVDPLDAGTAGLDPHQVVAQPVKLGLNLRGSRAADGHHADHRADADGHAQNGEEAAQLIAAQRANRLLRSAQDQHGRKPAVAAALFHTS
jgi:hypothetical protein